MSIKSAADETSSSKTLLPMAKRLYWNANGETNLLQWIDDLNQAAKAEFGIYAQCIQTGAIPTSGLQNSLDLMIMTRWTTSTEKCSNFE